MHIFRVISFVRASRKKNQPIVNYDYVTNEIKKFVSSLLKFCNEFISLGMLRRYEKPGSNVRSLVPKASILHTAFYTKYCHTPLAPLLLRPLNLKFLQSFSRVSCISTSPSATIDMTMSQFYNLEHFAYVIRNRLWKTTFENKYFTE